MKLIPFHVDHLDLLEARDDDPGRIGPAGDRRGLAVACAAAGPAVSMVVDGRLIAVLGVAVLWPGVGEAWTMMSAHVPAYRLSLHRVTLQVLGQAERHLKLHRVQSVCRADFAAGCLWLERLGFACEATLTAYGPDGANYLLFSKLMGLKTWTH